MKYPEIANRMTYILNLRGLKAQDLADKTGINKASISQYVNGSHCPSNYTATMMADVLRVDPIWLMGFEVPMEKPEEKINDSEHLKKYREFINLYSQLSDEKRTLVDNMLKALSEKQ